MWRVEKPHKNSLLVDMRIGTRDNVAHLKHCKLGLTLIPMSGIRAAHSSPVFRRLGRTLAGRLAWAKGKNAHKALVKVGMGTYPYMSHTTLEYVRTTEIAYP